jgi:hypothetical protein
MMPIRLKIDHGGFEEVLPMHPPEQKGSSLFHPAA